MLILHEIKRNDIFDMIDGYFRRLNIVYISATVGSGKSVAARLWAKTRTETVDFLSAGDEDFFNKAENSNAEILIIDNFEELYADDSMRLCFPNMLREIEKNKKILILGRACLPSYLKTFLLAGELDEIRQDSMLYSYSEFLSIIADCPVEIAPADMRKIYNLTDGHPMSVTCFLTRLANGSPIAESTMEYVMLDFYAYYDDLAYSKLLPDIQRTLMYLSVFREFSVELAVTITGNSHVSEILNRLVLFDSVFSETLPEKYRFTSFAFAFLTYMRGKSVSKEFEKNAYHNAGLYYELRNDLKNAFYYYNKEGNNEKLTELLIANSSNTIVAMAQYYELEEYYNALPEEVVMKSPELINGMSIISYLRFRPEECALWQKRLADFVGGLNKHDPHYGEAVIVKAANGLVIPCVESGESIAEKLKNFLTLSRNKKSYTRLFSATSCAPSLLNGSLDFCSWSKADRFYYKTMKGIVQLVLKNCAGIADIAIGESLFEKTSDTSFAEALTYISSGMVDAKSNGSFEIAFVGTALLSRIYAAEGNLSGAKSALNSLREDLGDVGSTRFYTHIRAFEVWLLMLGNDVEAVNSWLDSEAPDEKNDFRLLDRYIYMIKLRAYLIAGRYTDGLELAYKLSRYYKLYGRTYYLIQLNLLLAALLMRSKNDGWEEHISEALEAAEKYGFIRVIADEGIIALGLVKKYAAEHDSPYMNRLMAAIREQALAFPSYLKPTKLENIQLTKTQLGVIRLIESGLSNSEMADVLNISENTVRTHIKTIFGKFGVNNRVQAVQKAKQLGLLDS